MSYFQECFDKDPKDGRGRPKKGLYLVPGAVPTIPDPETYEPKPVKSRTKRSPSLPARVETPLKRGKQDHLYSMPSNAEPSPRMAEDTVEDEKDLKIKALEAELGVTKTKLAASEAKNKVIQQHLEQYKSLFFKEQQELIIGLKEKTTWSDECIVRAAHLRYLSGDTAYNFIKDTMKIPLPSVRCLNRRLEDLKVKPGFCEDSFRLLSISAKKLEPDQKYAVLVMDEMSIKPSMEWDPTHKYMSGFNTLPEHDEEVPVDEHGEHLNGYLL